jgi:nitrate reductase assembly molybdenum cofactor insertion protein NarJ
VSRAASFRLASALASYPSAETVERAARAEAAAEDEAAAGAIVRFASADARAREEEYVDLFDRGVADNPLHEGGYARSRGLGGAPGLADVGGFYRAFGLHSAGGERLDHLAVELEFYAWLLAKEEYLRAAGNDEGVERVTEGRRKFLADHLAPLAPAVARRPAIAASACFGPVFAWIAALVDREAASLSIQAVPFEPAPSSAEPDEVRCAAAGAGRLPVVAG